MLPKRVGEPSARRDAFLEVAPLDVGRAFRRARRERLASITAATRGTVRTRARMPSTLSTPRATPAARVRTDPVAL